MKQLNQNKIEIISYLSSLIPLRKLKNNKLVYVSKECPFCKEKSKENNVFRYNPKLKVGKSFCCGKSFKELYWLKFQIEHPLEAEIISIRNSDFYPENKKEKLIEYIKLRNTNENSIIKSESYEDDLNLPF